MKTKKHLIITRSSERFMGWRFRSCCRKMARKVVSPDEKFIKQIRETNNLRDRQDLENALEQAVNEWEKRNGLSKVQMRKLRPYQKDAIQEWNQNNCRGILEHATGSGKTFTALNAVKDFYKDWPIVVIGALSNASGSVGR